LLEQELAALEICAQETLYKQN